MQVRWLTWYSLLGLHFDGVRERPRPDACVRLDADGVDGVGREVTDGGELVVLHGLTLPGLYWQGRVGGVVQLVTRDLSVWSLRFVPLNHHRGRGEWPHVDVPRRAARLCLSRGDVGRFGGRPATDFVDGQDVELVLREGRQISQSTLFRKSAADDMALQCFFNLSPCPRSSPDRGW